MSAQSIRYWLADLIAGGALTRAKADNAMWFEVSAQLGAKFVLAGEAHADEVDRLRSERDILIIDNTAALSAAQYKAAGVIK